GSPAVRAAPPSCDCPRRCSVAARTAARPSPRMLRRTAGLREIERRAEERREAKDIGFSLPGRSAPRGDRDGVRMVGMSATSLFHSARTGTGGDEMFAADGTVRPTYQALHDALDGLGLEEFRARSESLALSYLDQGITFDYAGEEPPFPIDAIPRVIAAEEWSRVSAGVSQRVRALEHLLEDVYQDRRAVADGVIPAELIASSA